MLKTRLDRGLTGREIYKILYFRDDGLLIFEYFTNNRKPGFLSLDYSIGGWVQ